MRRCSNQAKTVICYCADDLPADTALLLDMPAILLEATELADRVAQMDREAIIDELALQQGTADARSQLEPGSFLFEYRLATSPNKAGELTEALAGRWAESPKAMDDPDLNFLPMFFGTVVDGGCAGYSAENRASVQTIQSAPVRLDKDKP